MCHSSSISSLAPSEQSKGAEQPRAGLKLVVLCPTPHFPENSSASEKVVVACVVVVVVVVVDVVAETEILFNKVKI